MSQKLFKILLLTVLAIGAIVLSVILLKAQNKKDAANNFSNIENPFGLDTTDTSLGGNGSGGQNGNNSGSNENTNTKPIPVDFISISDEPVLKKLSDEPAAGGTLFTVEREIIVPEEASSNLVEGYDFTGYPKLMFGSDQKEVADLKTVLNRQDPSPGLSIDNAFDTELKNAVISFQAKHSLSPDGVVASTSYKKLNEIQGIKPKVSTKPETETIEMVRYVDRANGYIYDKTTRLDEDAVRVTNNALPRVYEAYFSNTKDNVLMRYLKDSEIENYTAFIKQPAKSEDDIKKYATLDGKVISSKMSFFTLIGSGAKAMYITKESGFANLFVYDFKSKSAKKVWQSSFSDWVPQAVSENTVSLTPRASGLVKSNSYILDIKNNSLKKVISSMSGLTTNISPNGNSILFSYYENNKLQTAMLDVKSSSIKDFSPTTLSEKCVWTKDSKVVYCGAPSGFPSGVLPDDWYKGEALFEDSLWRTDATSLTANILVDKKVLKDVIDITNPQVNEKEDYMIFINKHDNNLWGIRF